MDTPAATPPPPGAPSRPAPRTPRFSQREFRDALGMFATGVTIVTARAADGGLVGLTANSFNSVSLKPPLVLWSLSSTAASVDVFRAGTHYAVHVLAAGQRALAERFATRGIDRFAGIAFGTNAHGTPILPGAAAVFECFNKSRYDEGDHVICVGQVEHCSHTVGAEPLLFHAGVFR